MTRRRLSWYEAVLVFFIGWAQFIIIIIIIIIIFILFYLFFEPVSFNIYLFLKSQLWTASHFACRSQYAPQNAVVRALVGARAVSLPAEVALTRDNTPGEDWTMFGDVCVYVCVCAKRNVECRLQKQNQF